MKRVLFLILFLALASRAQAAPTVFTTGQAAIVDASELTIGLDITGITNPGLIVGCGLTTGGGSDFVGVTWNGSENFTPLDNFHDAGNLRSGLWRLVGATPGNFDVVITQDATAPLTCGVLAFEGVNQTTPEGAVVTGSSQFDTASIDVSSGAGEMTVDLVFWDAGDIYGTIGGGQTLQIEQVAGDLSAAITMSTEPGAAGVITMSWTSSGDWLVQSGISLEAAAAPAVTTRRRAVIVQ